MPDWKKEINKRLTDLNLEPVREQEIIEELSQHLELFYEELRSIGKTEAEAAQLLLEDLNDSQFLTKELRRVERQIRYEPMVLETGRNSMIKDALQDLQYGVRMLRKSPGFTAVAILTLALGVGVNTAIFSLINGVLLRPLAFYDPDRLVMIWTDNPAYQLGFHEFPPANADLPEWRATATSFEQIALFQPAPADLSDDSDPERIGGAQISANLLPTLGIQPLIGRHFLIEEEQPGQDGVVLISYDLWQRRFGGDADIIDKKITLNGVPHLIVGVLPEGFNFPRATEMPRAYNLPERSYLWKPMAREASYWQSKMQRQLVCVVGRLKSGVTLTQAQTEMDAISAQQALASPQTHEGWRVWLTPLFNQIVGETRTPLLVLLGAVGFLLLIACANIASLLLARAAARSREMAVRAAIGAERSRIIRQLLTESLLLAALGGGFGLLLGYFGLDVLLKFIPPSMPRLQNISLDTNVFLFTILVSILTGVLFGLAPAWQASKVNLAEALKDAGRSNSAGRGLRSHGLLVTAEVALVAILLVGAVLMLQSFRQLLAVDPGFKPQGVAVFDVSLPWARYSTQEQRAQFFKQASSQLSALSGVQAIGAISNLPLSDNESMNYMAVEGAEPVPRGKEPLAEDRAITPGYFEAMGVSIVSGRDFDERDSAGKTPVAIVNEQLVRQFFPEGNAVGKRIKWVLEEEGWRTIVGVVRDVRGYALEVSARPQIYHPHAQSGWQDKMSIVIRSEAWALPTLQSAIKDELKHLDASLPVADYRTMPQLVSTAMARPRFTTLLLGLFAVTALVLTVVGLYGVVAYGVNQRTREIGIRMALGAQQRTVLALIIRQGMRPAIIGLGIGIAGALALMRLLASQLYEVNPMDPATFGIVAIGLFFVSLVACYIPARRAAKTDPIEALRHE